MTEDEAKTKWCPFVRVAVMRGVIKNTKSVTHSEVGNRDMEVGMIPRHSFCIGSQCMAWRWSEGRKEVAPDTPGAYQLALHEKRYFIGPFEGYCGLAGKPTP